MKLVRRELWAAGEPARLLGRWVIADVDTLVIDPEPLPWDEQQRTYLQVFADRADVVVGDLYWTTEPV